MAVEQENGFEVISIQTEPMQESCQSGHFAHQFGIDQHRFLPGGVVKEMEGTRQSTEGINPKGGVGRKRV